MNSKSAQIKKINDLIDSAASGESWWIDDFYHFDFNGEHYELLANNDFIGWMTKSDLKKAAKKIIMTGDYK